MQISAHLKVDNSLSRCVKALLLGGIFGWPVYQVCMISRSGEIAADKSNYYYELVQWVVRCLSSLVGRLCSSGDVLCNIYTRRIRRDFSRFVSPSIQSRTIENRSFEGITIVVLYKMTGTRTRCFCNDLRIRREGKRQRLATNNRNEKEEKARAVYTAFQWLAFE